MSRRPKISDLPPQPARPPERCRAWSTTSSDERPGIALHRAQRDPRLPRRPTSNFDFVCRAGVCGACAMIDGRPGRACRTLTSTLPAAFSLIRRRCSGLVADLSVDTGSWMRRASAERPRTPGAS